MASWRRPCSWRPAPPIEILTGAVAAACLALLGAGCGHAGNRAPAALTSAETPAPAAADAATTSLGSADALCVPSPTGSLRARLQGSIDAEIDWHENTPQCRGGVRPQGDGVRLLYKGAAGDHESLLLVFGIAQLRPGQSARNLPVNLTIVREGAGRFYATQGEDKCAMDEVRQSPLPDQPRLYRLEGRGYCTQPARAVNGDDALLLSRFDVVAIVAEPPDHPSPGRAGHETTP